MMLEYDQDIITGQIVAFLDGQADREDISRLDAWIEQSESNRAYFNRIKNIYEMSDRKIDPENIQEEKALGKVLHKIEPKKKTFRIGIWLQRAAAVLFIPLLAISVYLFLNKTETGATVNYCEIQAAAGLRSFITLPDGSKAWLNSGSKLRYPDRFTGDERIVFMEGEAYFEVAASLERPFIVNTPDIRVMATGTKFNVYDHHESNMKEVSLVSGKVSVSRSGADGQRFPIVELNPDQHLKYDPDNDAKEVVEGDVYKYYAWKDNKIIFRNDPLSEVVKRIGDIYGVDIELEGEELNDYRYRATFEEESLHEILKLLKMSAPINYREVKRKQNDDGSFSPHKIIIYSVNQ